MQKILREHFGDTTAERLAEQITAGALINYDKALANGDLKIPIKDHLGDLSQKVDGKFIHRDPTKWLERGVSQPVLDEIVAAEFDIGELQDETTAYKALFDYKEQNYSEMLSISNSKGAVFAGAELSKLLDE